MERKVALAIGVDRVSGMPPLNAAALGATEFAEWARSQNYEVILLTDQGASVTIATIKEKLKQLVEDRNCSQLLVYFSGHGILRGPDEELWLLSGAPSDPGEAVRVAGSVVLARRVGIPHVAFFSDACRSAPTGAFSGVDGSLIFLNLSAPVEPPEIDSFYGTRIGDPSREVPVAEAVAGYSGIFTKCLLDGLTTNDPADVETWVEGITKRYVVTSRTLKKRVARTVPMMAGKISIKLHQYPESRVESDKPKYLAELSASVLSTPTDDISRESLPQPNPPPDSPQIAALSRLNQTLWHGNNESDTRSESDEDGGVLRAQAQQLINTRGRESFETGTGFTIIGAGVIDIHVNGGRAEPFFENETLQIRVSLNNPFSFRRNSDEREFDSDGGSILLRFDDGTGTCLAVLPGFIGTVVVDAGRVVSVSYFPARRNRKYKEYARRDDEIRKRQAFAATAARNGMFQLTGEETHFAGSYLGVERLFDTPRGLYFDPTLGLYAAYAYNQAGRFKEVENVWHHMFLEPEPVLFDVVMLAGALSKVPPYDAFNPFYPRIVPSVPLLTQGWGMLDVMGMDIPSYLMDVRRELIPSLWTTLTPRGIDIMIKAMKEGKLR